jgi:hypothetical protein
MLLAGFALCAVMAGVAQNSSPAAPSSSGQSLGDLARKVRKERGADGVPARDRLDSDDDGPDSGGVWRIRLIGRGPAYEVSVTLPQSPKWKRATAEPRPVLIPLPGPEDDPDRVIRLYATAFTYPFPTDASRTFLQGWFARPEYFGRAAHIVLNEHVQIDGLPATVSHFSVTSGSVKYHGVGVVMMPNGGAGFACVYRDQDAVAATSICDAIVQSATDQSLVDPAPKVYPPYSNPYPGNNDPSDDPPEDNDPD